MSATKKYYWLKLNVNFFDKEEIKLIEGMPNGKDYIIFYMKLLLKSANTEGRLMFRDVIPYTVEMLSSITNTNFDTVKTATEMFIQLGMMEKLDDGALFMVETQNMIGSETEFAKKKREYREKLKSNQNQLEDKTKTKKDNVRQEIEIDKEIEKEIDIYNIDQSNFDDEKVKFRKNFNRYIEIVCNSTGIDKFRVENVITPSVFRDIDLEEILLKISESRFLRGVEERKPQISNFTDIKMLKMILVDRYKDKNNVKEVNVESLIKNMV